MNKKKISIGSILLALIINALTIYMCLIFEPVERKINDCYQVYLSGKKIGLIKSKEELYDLIDSEQKEVKDKYGVNKVHSPQGLEVQNIKTIY